MAAAVAAPGLPSEQLFVRGIFRIVDVDADGLLSREEFSQLQKQLGHEVPSQEQWGRMCAALECEPQPPPGIAMAAGAAGGAVITPAAFWQLYRMSESSARADYETLAALHGGEISALLAGVADDAADGQSDASFLAVARAEDAANRRKPKRAGGASARRSTRAPGRKVQTMKSTYSKPVTVRTTHLPTAHLPLTNTLTHRRSTAHVLPRGHGRQVMINADNDLYGTRTNLIAEVHKRANVQSDMVAVLRDSAEQCKQEGLADKANLVEQSCAYVKQEADAIRKVVFENAVERLSARARQKTEVEEAMHAKAEADRVRQEQQHRERIVLRRQRKTRLEEERQLTIAAKQHAARALNESARHRAAQQTQQLAAVQAQQAAARVKLEAGHARVLAQQERQRQRRLAEARRARVKERAEATARKQAAEVEVEEVQKRRQVELLERAVRCHGYGWQARCALAAPVTTTLPASTPRLLSHARSRCLCHALAAPSLNLFSVVTLGLGPRLAGTCSWRRRRLRRAVRPRSRRCTMLPTQPPLPLACSPKYPRRSWWTEGCIQVARVAAVAVATPVSTTQQGRYPHT